MSWKYKTWKCIHTIRYKRRYWYFCRWFHIFIVIIICIELKLIAIDERVRVLTIEVPTRIVYLGIIIVKYILRHLQFRVFDIEIIL